MKKRPALLFAVAALLTGIATASVALAQEPPPPPPPPDQHRQSPRDVEQTGQTERRREARRDAAAGQAVRQRKHGISPVRYAVGGLIGTFSGLGLGHAIVGEWTNKGWIFTVGEIGTGVMTVYGMAQALSHDRNTPSARRGEMFMIAGALSMTVLRVYEVYDIWTRPTVAAVDQSADAAFAVGPMSRHGGFGALFQLRW